MELHVYKASLSQLEVVSASDHQISGHNAQAAESAAGVVLSSSTLAFLAALDSSKYYDLASKYLPDGKSGIITFGLKKGYEAAKKVADSTKIFALLANIGDTKSLIIHPSSTTHSQLNEKEQKSTGVTRDLIRISVGIEDLNDLKNDLDQAFKKI